LGMRRPASTGALAVACSRSFLGVEGAPPQRKTRPDKTAFISRLWRNRDGSSIGPASAHHRGARRRRRFFASTLRPCSRGASQRRAQNMGPGRVAQAFAAKIPSCCN